MRRTSMLLTRLMAGVMTLVIGTPALVSGQSSAPALTGDQKVMLRAMLKAGFETVRDYYFDPKFNGVNWNARYVEYQARLAAAPTIHAGLQTVAEMIDGLGDSHTHFFIPGWQVDYGYDLMAVGERLHVASVRPGSDAAAKLHTGDVVTAWNEEPVTRATLARTRYVLSALTPLTQTRLTLKDGDGSERTVDVRSTVTANPMLRMLGSGFRVSDLVRQEQEAEFAFRARTVSLGKVLVWKMPRFISDLGDINRAADIALKHEAVVLDLRGNPGGYLEALTRLSSVLFSTKVTLGTTVERKGPSPITVTPRGNRTFNGKLIVLVDSESASSAEVIARAVQIEGRGIALGDRSAGAVRVSAVRDFLYGMDSQTPYAFSITIADLLMRDGSSLEGRGVTPDELLLPSQDDLAQGRDPVLSRAIALAGGVLDAIAAGKLFR